MDHVATSVGRDVVPEVRFLLLFVIRKRLWGRGPGGRAHSRIEACGGVSLPLTPMSPPLPRAPHSPCRRRACGTASSSPSAPSSSPGCKGPRTLTRYSEFSRMPRDVPAPPRAAPHCPANFESLHITVIIGRDAAGEAVPLSRFARVFAPGVPV